MEGYIKLFRQMLTSEIWNAPPWIRIVWIWLLLNANYKDHRNIKRGEILTRYEDIYSGCGFTKREVESPHDIQRAIKKLKKSSMIATRKATRGVVITICNYNEYQDMIEEKSSTKSSNLSQEKLQEVVHDKERSKKERKTSTPSYKGDTPEIRLCQKIFNGLTESQKQLKPWAEKMEDGSWKLSPSKMQTWAKKAHTVLGKVDEDRAINLISFAQDKNNSFVVESPEALNDKLENLSGHYDRSKGLNGQNLSEEEIQEDKEREALVASYQREREQEQYELTLQSGNGTDSPGKYPLPE